MTLRLTTRLAVRPVTRLAVGYTPPGGGPDPGTPVISIVGGGALLPGTIISSTMSLPWLADGVQIAPASLSLELPWTVAPGAVITQPGSNALTVAGYHADAANYLNRVAIKDDESLEQPVQWVWDVFFRQMADTDHPTPTAASHKIALQAGTAIPMIGARTLAGALEPLYPGMPTPTGIGLVAGDYDRTMGITGNNSSSKYIDTNVNAAGVDIDDIHLAVYETAADSGGAVSPIGVGTIFLSKNVSDQHYPRLGRGEGQAATTERQTGLFAGTAYNSDTTYMIVDSNVSSVARSNANPSGDTFFILRRTTNLYTDATIGFASIGTAIDLEYMDTCLTTLQSSIAAALS